MLSVGGVYAIINTVTWQPYIGRSHDCRWRTRGHLGRLRSGTHENSNLREAASKYGAGKFIAVLLERVDDPDVRIQREQWYIDHTNKWSLNISQNAKGGGGFWSIDRRESHSRRLRGRKHSAEAKAKISRSHVGLRPSDETREKLSAWQRGRRLTDEHKKKISEKSLGRRLTPEQRVRQIENGRLATVLRIGKMRGTRNPAAKLDDDRIVEMKRLRATGFTQQSLADRFGVAQAHVSKILRNKVWSHAGA